MSRNVREDEYFAYLDRHITGVKRSWSEILMPKLLESNKFDADTLGQISSQIDEHDTSKYDDIEFNAYCNYFYPTDKCPKNEVEFDFAWLHHQKVNPHHWQYWCLIRDEGEIVPMDMALTSIFEMLCDWHSFSLRNPESTAYTWYKNNKDKMIFSDETRKTVEQYIDYFKEPLTQK